MRFLTEKTSFQEEQFIAALLTAWEAEGYLMSTDKHLQLQEVLLQLPPDTPLSGLRNYIAPILTQDAQKQIDFYRIFDQTLTLCAAQTEAHAQLVKQEKKNLIWNNLKKPVYRLRRKTTGWWQGLDKRLRLILLAVVLPALIAGLTFAGYRWHSKRNNPIPISNNQVFLIHTSLLERSARNYCFRAANPDLGKITEVEPISGPPAFVNLDIRFDAEELCIKCIARQQGRDDLKYRVCFSGGTCMTFSIVFRSDYYRNRPNNFTGSGGLRFQEYDPGNLPQKIPLTPREDSVAANVPILGLDTTNTLLETSQFTNQPGQYVSDVSSAWHFGPGNAYITPVKGILTAVTALLLYLLGIAIRHKRQKFTIQHQSGQKPPYAWTMRVPFVGKVFMGEVFYMAVTEMRRRSLGEVRQIDMPRTIQATIRKAGMIDLKYRFHYRNRDYLFLIDTKAPQNLRTKLYNLIAAALMENEAPIEVFYYDGDIRLCWNEKHRHGIAIRELQHKYRDHHLVIWGTGNSCLNYSTGQLAGWAGIFDAWKQRVLMNPRPVNDWDNREAALAQKFRILPASLKGLAALVETLEAVEAKNYLLWKKIQDENMHPVFIPDKIDQDLLLTILESEFVVYKNGQRDDRLVRWIASCALPPVLMWDWMLYTGELLSQPGEQFLTIENLYKITRIPWFSNGEIPENCRSVLLAWLEQHYPGWEITIRHEWGKILSLETNLPPVGSLAWHGHRIQVILHELLTDTNWRRRRELETELDNLLQSMPAQDAMVIKYIERRKSPLDTLLSDRFRKFVQEKRGTTWHWRDWTWQVAGTLIVFIATLLVHYTEPVRVFQFEDYISKVAFSTDNNTFAATGGGGSVALCQTDGTWLQGRKDNREKIVETIFSENGNTIFTGSSDGILKYWDISGAPLFSYKTSDKLITSMKFTADFSKIFIGYYNGEAKLWDVANKKVLISFTAHKDAVLDVDISPSEEILLTCSRDSTAKIWTMEGKLLHTLTEHKDQVLTGCFSPYGNMIATGSRDETAILWSIDGDPVQVINGHRGNILDILFTRDGQSVITASADKTAKIWSAGGKLLRTLEGHSDKINTINISSDGTMLLTGSSDRSVRIWQLGK